MVSSGHSVQNRLLSLIDLENVWLMLFFAGNVISLELSPVGEMCDNCWTHAKLTMTCVTISHLAFIRRIAIVHRKEELCSCTIDKTITKLSYKKELSSSLNNHVIIFSTQQSQTPSCSIQLQMDFKYHHRSIIYPELSIHDIISL